jgi:hypothetical protein
MKRARIRVATPKPKRLRIRMRIDGKLCTPEQALLITQLRGRGYAALPEVRFHPERKWQIDVAVARLMPGVKTLEDITAYAFVGRAVAVEINGGAWSRGRHVRGQGFIDDMSKLNALTELGWRILQFTPQQVLSGEALAQIIRCL